MKKSILSIVMMLLCVLVYAQELPNIIQPSPETAALLKFINTPVNYSNGLPSIQIPFYTIKTKSGLNIPIYISYHASGIKVNEHATQVGLGWKLSVGGMISNEIHGETDEHTFRRYPDFGGGMVNSLSRFGLIRDMGALYCSSPETLNISYDYALEVTGFGVREGNPKLGDALPDIYYYETPTESGKFVYDSDFNAHPIPYVPLSIERNHGGKITIIDQNGNSFNYNDISSYTTEPNLSSSSNLFREQSKLSRIVTPLKETINYSYSTEKYTYLNPETFIDYTRIPSAGCGDKAYYDRPITTHFVNQRLDKIEFDTGRVEFYYSDDEIYKIENSTVRKDLPGSSALRRVVVYNNQNVIIKDFELSYSYFESNYGYSSDSDKYRLKLDRVTQKGEQPYNLTYVGNGTIPHRLSTQQDYWGYYGGAGGLLPAVRFQDIVLSGSDRSVNESLIKTGALEKITYPTGGNTQFYFNEVTYKHPQVESSVEKNRTPLFNTIGTHSFSLPADDNNQWKIYFFNECGDTTGGISKDYCLFSLYNQNGNLIAQKTAPGVYEILGGQLAGTTCTVTLEGNPSQTCNYGIYIEGESMQEIMVDKKTQLPGLRLDRMVKEPLTGLPITTIFNYKIPESERISKDVAIPIFHYLEKRITGKGVNHQEGATDCRYLVRKGTPVLSTQSSYEHVTEHSPGNGYTKYHFKPAISGINNLSALSITTESADSRKLLSKAIYSETNKILKKEEHRYETDYSVNQASSDYRTSSPSALTLGLSFSNVGSWSENCLPTINPDVAILKYLLEYNIFNINSGWVKNTQSINTRYYYNQNDVLMGYNATTTDYFYDNPIHAQVTRTETTNSKEEVIKTTIEYAHDVNDTRLINENRIAVPLGTKTYKKEDSKPEVLLLHQKTEYDSIHNPDRLYLPSIIQTSKGLNPLEDRVIYHAYDTKGNPTEVSKKDGTKIYYVWGYQQTQPIAKITGYTTAELSVAQTKIDVAIAASNNDSSVSLENTLRDKLQLVRDAFPNSQVTTFTYDPLIGVTSTTDQRGETMYYEYDNFNRLEFVKDAQKNILKENKYNYKN